MNLDPHRHDDPAGDAQNAEAYAVLRRMRSDLIRDLDTVLPVEAAITVTRGSELEPDRPLRVSRSRAVQQWLLGVWTTIAQLVRVVTGRLVSVTVPAPVFKLKIGRFAFEYSDSRDAGSPLARAESEVAALISIAQDAGAHRLTQLSAATTVFLLQELREGLQERALSKERAQTLMTQAHQQFDDLVKTIERVKFPVWQLLPLPVFGVGVGVLVAGTGSSWPLTMAATAAGAGIFTLATRLSRWWARATHCSLSVDGSAPRSTG
jgi:hypothetical protein